jgi:elongation factor P--(R)-beta-lysine ligase
MMNAWQSAASLESLRERADVYRHIREFFFARQVLEVQTPMLSQAGNSDFNIESFQVQFTGPALAGQAARWLRTSPEFALKRLLAGGIGDCYELGRVFRNGEFGSRHNPEFSMLEWYRVGWTHLDLIEECTDLLQQLFAAQGRSLQVLRVPFAELFLQQFGLDPHTCSDESLFTMLDARVAINPDGLQRDDALDLLLTHCIEPTFPADQLTAIVDFPASQCALAKIRRDAHVAVAERFELYLGPVELANGYHELTDASEQRMRFEADLNKRRLAGKPIPAMDELLLMALPQLPACAGVAMGIERLLMCLLQKPAVADVFSFDFSAA